jgi:hypothetical protein
VLAVAARRSNRLLQETAEGGHAALWRGIGDGAIELIERAMTRFDKLEWLT